jgi:hypothetical protein
MNHTQYFKLNDVIHDVNIAEKRTYVVVLESVIINRSVVRTGSVVKMTLYVYLPFGILQTLETYKGLKRSTFSFFLELYKCFRTEKSSKKLVEFKEKVIKNACDRSKICKFLMFLMFQMVYVTSLLIMTTGSIILHSNYDDTCNDNNVYPFRSHSFSAISMTS